MKKRIPARVYISLFLVLTGLLVLLPLCAAAQTIDSSDFTVRAVIPDNQKGSSKSYFDLLMKPGQTQALSVDVINNGAAAVTIDVALRAASTNRNGLIEYQVTVAPDETLKTPFNTIADTVNQVVVEPRSTKRVHVTVTMPGEEFDGAILGGIIFTKRSNNSNASPGVSINNQFSYVIGVKLSETDVEIFPDFRIKSIEPTLINYRKAVSVAIHNPVALIVKNANVSAHVYKENETTPLFSVNKNGVDMAPNSVFPLPIEWAGQNIEPGEYRLRLKLTYDGRVWEWDQEFTMDADKVKDVNDNALDTPIKTNWWSTWWWIPMMFVLVFLLVWFAFVLGRRKRDEEKRNHSFS